MTPPKKVGAISPTIKLDGTPLEHKWLVKLLQMRIDRPMCQIGRATMRFTDNGYELADKETFALGKAIVISEPGATDLFEGIVTGIKLEQTTSSLPQLIVVADDAAVKLLKGTRTKTYLEQTYTSVISEMATRAGMTADVTSSSLTLDYFLQAGTDLAFLDVMTERLGYSWWVDAKKLVAKRPSPEGAVATLALGAELRDFSVRASGLRPTTLSVFGWDNSKQEVVTGASKPGDYTVPDAKFLRKYAQNSSSPINGAQATVVDARPLSNAEATAIAGAMYRNWTSSAVVADGTCAVNSKIKPGTAVAITDAGPASGTYLVTEVEHSFDRDGFRTRFVSGPLRAASLVDTLGNPGADPGFALSGLVVGVVTDIKDPNNSGRVKIKYTGVDGEIEGPWGRVLALGGGAKRGAVFQPEVNDEVLVGFEHGDTRRPVVLGGLFSQKNALPTGDAYVGSAGTVDIRRITSRKNHIVEFSDGDADPKQHVLLQLGTKPHKLRLGADKVDLEVGSGIPITIKAGDSQIAISNSGDITIEGNNITIKAKQNLQLEAQMNAKIKGAVEMGVEGNMVSVKAQATGEVSASGPLTVKGATVMIN
jgi:uncharacterized protein involved in type VI secretion and phage assembly